MKHFLISIIFLTGFFCARADEPTSMQEWLKSIEWNSPKRTGVASIDDLYDQSDKLYMAVKNMSDSVPMYSLRSIVENGDTVAIVVVDQNNKPYQSSSAATQMIKGGLYLTSLTAQGLQIPLKYASLATDIPNIIKVLGFGSIRAGKDFFNSQKKVGKIFKEIMPQLKDFYNKRGNPIKEYAKASSEMSADGGFVTEGFDNVPSFDPEDMPSDEELDIILEQERQNRAK